MPEFKINNRNNSPPPPYETVKKNAPKALYYENEKSLPLARKGE